MASVRATTTLAPIGNVNTNTTPPTISAPTMAAGDLLFVAVFFAQATGSVTIFTPDHMQMISIVGTATNRLGAIFATVVSDPADFASGISLRCGATATRVAAVAFTLQPGSGESFSMLGLTTSGPDWNGSTMSSDTFPGAVSGDLILGVEMTNKGASTTYSVHSGVGGATAIAQAQALATSSSPGVSQADSVVSAWIGGTGVSFNTPQANGQAYSVGISITHPGDPVGLPVKMGNGAAAHATYLDGGSERAMPASIRVFYPGFASIAQMEATPGATWAHRGDSITFPEMSEYAYDRAVTRGFGAIEFSARRSLDGVWFGLHDTTLARTSENAALTVDVTTMTWTEIQAYFNTLRDDDIPRPYYELDDFLEKYTNHILIIDNKLGSFHTTELLPKLLAYPNATQRFILKLDGSITLARFQESKAAGFKTAGYWYAATYASILPAKVPYTDYIGMEYTATQTVWDDIQSYGKMTWGHVCPSQAAYDTAIAKGADFVQCSASQLITPVR